MPAGLVCTYTVYTGRPQCIRCHINDAAATLTPTRARLLGLNASLSDTTFIRGSEAYIMPLMFCNSVKQADKNGIINVSRI